MSSERNEVDFKVEKDKRLMGLLKLHQDGVQTC